MEVVHEREREREGARWRLSMKVAAAEGVTSRATFYVREIM